MKDTSIIELSFEHLDPELIDIKCEVEVEITKGTTEGFTSDDPGELDVISVKLLEPITVKGVTLEVGETLYVDKNINKQIIRHYEN